MIKFVRRWYLSVVVCLLFSACGSPAYGDGNDPENQGATPTTTPTRFPDISSCPKPLTSQPDCQTPARLHDAYGIEELHNQGFTGKGQTVVVIVSFGSPTLQQDMEVFDRTYGLPPVDLEIISPLDIPEQDLHNDKAGWAMETSLDVQMIHAIAPEAKIVVLTSPVAETQGIIGLPEFRQLQEYIIEHKVGNIVSQSWGASELTLQDEAGQKELALWDELYERGTTKHDITYFSASGDQGATDYFDESLQLADEPTTIFAAGSPWVTSVGGTSLMQKQNAVQEEAWPGSGGGFSRFYPTPSYQQQLPAAVQTQLANRRGVPDVAAVADPSTALSIYHDGQWLLVGGTSAATPLWAGMMALANQMAEAPLGFINPVLYELAATDQYPQYFRDITEGNNTNSAANVEGYPAVPGWDPLTGLGVPNATHLLPALVAASD